MDLKRTRQALLYSAVAFSFSAPAFALDGKDLLDKINTAYANQGGKLAAENVEVQGDSVVLKGLSVTPTGSDTTLPVGDVTLSDVEETSGGGYKVGTATFPDFRYPSGTTVISVSGFKIGDITVPANANAEGLDGFFYVGSLTTGPVQVVEDKEVFSISAIDIKNTLRSDKSGFDADGTISDIKLDLASMAKDAQAKDAIEKMQVQNVEGTMTLKGSWELAPGTLDIANVALDFDNIGKLDFGFKISGYTLAFMNSLRDATKQAESNPNKQEAQQAMGLAMLGLMQQLTLDGAHVRFDDDSITKRALDYAGSMQKVSGDQLASSLKAMVPLMMAQLNMPDLQNAVSSAVNTYLDDPKNLNVTVAPAQPTPFPMLVGAAMGAPNTLPQVLGLKVEANTAE